jgi:hypothetical protein
MDMPIRDEQIWEWLDDASPRLAEHLRHGSVVRAHGLARRWKVV